MEKKKKTVESQTPELEERWEDLIIDWEPHEKQRLIDECDSPVIVAVCGRRFGKTWMAIKKLVEYAFRKAHSRVWYVAPCYDDKTEVLTNRGWLGFDKVTLKDKVAILDRGKLLFEKPKKIHLYPFEGDLIGYKDNFIDMAVTPNHRCYVRNANWKKKRNWDFKESQEIFNTEKYLFKKSCRWEGNVLSNKYWFELMGLWFSDGSARLRGKDGEVIITQKKYAEYVENLIAQNGIKLKKYSRGEGNGFNYNIGNKEMAKEFVKYGNSYTKAIPDYIKNASSELILAFLNGYWVGDGSFHKDKTYHRAITGSKQLANDIQELIIKAGYSANIRKVKHLFSITFLGKAYNEVLLRKKYWKKIPYNGMVGCVETRTGVVMVRRNGVNYLCGNTYQQAYMVAWKRLLQFIPRELVKRQHSQRLEIELVNGSLIEFKGVENEENLLGVGLDYVVLDEYGSMKPHVWNTIIEPMFATTKLKALFIGTPKGKNHFYTLFNMGIEGKPDYNVNYKSFHFVSADSPYVSKDFIEQKRKELPGNLFREEYEASFEDFTGLIYPEFNRNYHVIEPRHIPVYWKRVHAIDPSISTGVTACVFTAMDENNNVIVYDEYYSANEMASTHAEAILEKYDPNKDTMLIDPHSANKTIQREGQFFAPIDEYIACGISPILGESHVDAGINRVREFLKIDEDKIHPFKEHLKGSPKLFVFNTCHNFIREMEFYRWADRPESKMGLLKPVPYKKNDHILDGLRYILTSRIKGDMPDYELINPNSPWGRDIIKRRSKNGDKYAH